MYPNCSETLAGVAELNDLPLNENPVYKSLVGFTMFVGRYFADLVKSTFVILCVGFLATSSLSYLWVWGAQVYVRPIIMSTLFCAVLIPLALTLILWGKAGKLGGDAQSAMDDFIDINENSIASDAASASGVAAILSSIGQREYENMAIASSVFTSLLFILVVTVLDKVELACGILIEASHAIKRMPLILVRHSFSVPSSLLTRLLCCARPCGASCRCFHSFRRS